MKGTVGAASLPLSNTQVAQYQVIAVLDNPLSATSELTTRSDKVSELVPAHILQRFRSSRLTDVLPPSMRRFTHKFSISTILLDVQCRTKQGHFRVAAAYKRKANKV